MNRILKLMPDLELEEAVFIDSITRDKTDEDMKNFMLFYRGRRRDPMIILITTLLGFFCLAGVQRFLVNQIGMGILYLLTGGLCLIGTIIDLVNYKSLTNEYNKKVAQELLLHL